MLYLPVSTLSASSTRWSEVFRLLLRTGDVGAGRLRGARSVSSRETSFSTPCVGGDDVWADSNITFGTTSDMTGCVSSTVCCTCLFAWFNGRALGRRFLELPAGGG